MGGVIILILASVLILFWGLSHMTMVQSYQQSKSCSYSLSKTCKQFRIQIIPEKIESFLGHLCLSVSWLRESCGTWTTLYTGQVVKEGETTLNFLFLQMEDQVWEDSTYDCVVWLWILLLLLQQKLMLQILVWFVCQNVGQISWYTYLHTRWGELMNVGGSHCS